ncbi:MAG: ectoine dioxygenase [Planctomycetota bacterium]
MLSPTQIQRFHEDGYAVVDGMLTPSEWHDLRDATQRIVANPHGRASAAEYLQDQYATQWGVFSEHLWIDEATAESAVLRVRDNPRARAVASALLNVEAKASRISMQIMYPRCGCKQPWHQDHTPGDRNLWWINCMYYLEEMTSENGSLLVVPGSHRTPLNRRLPDYGPIPGSVRVLPKPGAAVFFYMSILHAADEHLGPEPRRGVKTHYSLPHIDPLDHRHEQRYARGVRRRGHEILRADDGVHSFWFAEEEPVAAERNSYA